MGERATLRLDSGREVRVEVIREDVEADEIVVHHVTEEPKASASNLLEIIDAHLTDAPRHPAGTTDRLLADDRDQR
jgi:hypothetical protein